MNKNMLRVVIIGAIVILIIIVYEYENTRNKTIIKNIKDKEIKIELIEDIKAEVSKNEMVDNSPELISLGEFKLTAYCSCHICCGKWAYNRPNGIVYGSIGEPLKQGYSIAVDPSIIPYRTEVVINGDTFKAQDCGGAIKGNRIDVYMEDHQKALEFGVQYAEVFIRKEK